MPKGKDGLFPASIPETNTRVGDGKGKRGENGKPEAGGRHPATNRIVHLNLLPFFTLRHALPPRW